MVLYRRAMESFLEEDHGEREKTSEMGEDLPSGAIPPGNTNQRILWCLMPQSARKHPNNFSNNVPTGLVGLPKSPMAPIALEILPSRGAFPASALKTPRQQLP